MKPSERRKARQFAVQALYQWRLAGTDLTAIETQFFEDFDFSKADVEYFKELLFNIPQQVSAIDAAFEPFLDRILDELGPVEISILRISTYELLHRPDVPYKVVINEGVELSKRFAPTEAHKFVNGVLDNAAIKLRAAEAGTESKSKANFDKKPDVKIKSTVKISYKPSINDDQDGG
tara:strand:- start:10097 stop:10627 length:531 start_codon:yes stop_codon:yes gene_type:complete